MRVRIPTPLRSYTGGVAEVAVDAGPTLGAVLDALDVRYPGIKFRMVDEQGEVRKHVNLFVAGERCRDLTMRLDHVEEVVIMQALSGG
jgi:molybdopterin converting factor small subunit